MGSANWKHPRIGAKNERGISKRKKPVNSTPSASNEMVLITMPATQHLKNHVIQYEKSGVFFKKLIAIAVMPPMSEEKKQIVIPVSPLGIYSPRSLQL